MSVLAGRGTWRRSVRKRSSDNRPRPSFAGGILVCPLEHPIDGDVAGSRGALMPLFGPEDRRRDMTLRSFKAISLFRVSQFLRSQLII